MSEKKQRILELREKDYSYGEIAKMVGTPIGTVRGYCGKEKLKQNSNECLNCGRRLKKTVGHKAKKFCDNKCRYQWRIQHPELRKLTAIRECTCGVCGDTFTVYGNTNRKYCSQECYQKSRFGGVR